MKKFKRVAVIGAAILAISANSIIAFASAYNSPAEIVAGLTGKTAESVIAERMETNKTYGTIAKEAGKLEEFKKEILAMKKAVLDERVKAGTITQEKANEIITAIENNQANCDGTGSGRIGRKFGGGFGRMRQLNRGDGSSGSKSNHPVFWLLETGVTGDGLK